jgi:hypothetical protein
VWPALSRYKRTRRKTDEWQRHRSSVAGVKTTCSIEKAALLSVLRRWCPISRLEAWQTAVCATRNHAITVKRSTLTKAAVLHEVEVKGRAPLDRGQTESRSKGKLFSEPRVWRVA